MTESNLAGHELLKDRVVEAFRKQYDREPAVVVRAPGRVNLLGGHVDYNDGWVLPAAINRSVWLAAASREDSQVQIAFIDFETKDRFSLDTLDEREQVGSRHSLYPAGIAWALRQAGYQPVGLDVVLTSDVPIGGGVSSSAAVEMAFVTAWDALGQMGVSNLEKARIGRRAENDYLGVATGIMDQFASVHGAKDHLILLDCRSLEHVLIPFPSELVILIADSGIRRELAGSEYNVRRQQCEEAVRLLQPYLPGIHALRDVTPEALELYAHRLPLLLRRRAQHVVGECARVLVGAEALRRGDAESLGQAMRHSHASVRDLYEVSIPEMDLLAATAWQTAGCYGARLTGAGFGGCVAVVAETEAAPVLKQNLNEAYQREFKRTLTVFEAQPAAGASVVSL